MSEYLIPILIILFLILINGLFVAAEFAIVGVPNTRIAQRAEQGSSVAKRVLTILRDPDRQNQYIATDSSRDHDSQLGSWYVRGTYNSKLVNASS